MNRALRRSALTVALGLCFATNVHAQSNTAGAVFGQAAAGDTVVVESPSTGFKREIRVGNDGSCVPVTGEKIRLDEQNYRLQKENEALRQRIHRVRNDDDYLEKLAREELNMVRPGEVVYRFQGAPRRDASACARGRPRPRAAASRGRSRAAPRPRRRDPP